MDPKELHQAMKRSHYPMPTIEEVTRLTKDKVFTVLDAKSGFWQIKLDEKVKLLDHVPNGFWQVQMVADAFWHSISTGDMAAKHA